MSVTAETLIKTFSTLLQPLDGDLRVTAEQPSSQTHPTANSIAYVADAEHLLALLDSPVAMIVVHNKISQLAKEKNAGRKTLLMTPNTYLSMALINQQFFALPHVRAPFDGVSIHPTAVVSETAILGKNVILGPYAVVSAQCEIGEGTFLGAHAVVEANTKIGRECFIHPQVYIGHSCLIGDRVEIKPHSTVGSDGFGYAHDAKGQHYRIPHYGAVMIENDVHIGANVNIDRGTFEPAIIGAGTKIDNHCHFGHNVRIGKNCLITAGMIVAGSTEIGDNCVFGGRTSVNGHIKITSGCTFGPASGITNDVTKPGVYAGFPPIPFRDFLKVQASFKHLPEMRKKLARVMKKLGLHDDSEKTSRDEHS